MSKVRRCFFGLLAFTLLSGVCTPGLAHAQSREYQIKAAFLYNFAQFVKWPADSFSSPTAPLNIGILGDDPFGGALEKMVQGESIGGRHIVIRRGQRFDDLKDCQMIFISRSEEDHMAAILTAVDSKPILTVSEVGNFTQDGGIINFYLQADKVRFEINPSSAHRVGLKISSQLLNLGRIVDPSKEGA